MADNSYVRFNSLVDVATVKVDTDISKTFKEAIDNKDIMESSTILWTNYSKATIDASYLSPESKISGAIFSIYRKVPNQKYYNYVYTLKYNDFNVLDYNIVSNQFYHYSASVEIQNSDGTYEYLTYENFTPDREESYYTVHFDEWSLCNIDYTDTENIFQKSGDVWNFCLAVENNNISQNLNITNQDTLSRFSKTSMGVKNYDSGSLTCLLGNIKDYNIFDIPAKGAYPYKIVSVLPNPAKTQISLNTHYILSQPCLLNNVVYNKGIYKYLYDEETGTYSIIPDTSVSSKYIYSEKYEKYNAISGEWEVNDPYARETEKLERWKVFCADGKLKLLKDPKGHAWIVQISEAPNYGINYMSNLKQTTITFSWKEALDINNISIIGNSIF